MKKTFKYKELEVDVVSNYTNNNKLHFPTDVKALVEQTFKLCNHGKTGEATDETFLVSVFEVLKHNNIAPKEVRFREFSHTGTKLTDIGQTKLTEVIEDDSTAA